MLAHLIGGGGRGGVADAAVRSAAHAAAAVAAAPRRRVLPARPEPGPGRRRRRVPAAGADQGLRPGRRPARRAARKLREPPARGGGGHAALARAPARAVLFSSVFSGQFRFWAEVLLDELGLPRAAFWAPVREIAGRYREENPDLATRFDACRLFAPDVERVTLNREHLAGQGFDKVERDDEFDVRWGRVPNPLHAPDPAARGDGVRAAGRPALPGHAARGGSRGGGGLRGVLAEDGARLLPARCPTRTPGSPRSNSPAVRRRRPRRRLRRLQLRLRVEPRVNRLPASGVLGVRTSKASATCGCGRTRRRAIPLRRPDLGGGVRRGMAVRRSRGARAARGAARAARGAGGPGAGAVGGHRARSRVPRRAGRPLTGHGVDYAVGGTERLAPLLGASCGRLWTTPGWASSRRAPSATPASTK